jgi:hypothetical protein
MKKINAACRSFEQIVPLELHPSKYYCNCGQGCTIGTQFVASPWLTLRALFLPPLGPATCSSASRRARVGGRAGHTPQRNRAVAASAVCTFSYRDAWILKPRGLASRHMCKQILAEGTWEKLECEMYLHQETGRPAGGEIFSEAVRSRSQQQHFTTDGKLGSHPHGGEDHGRFAAKEDHRQKGPFWQELLCSLVAETRRESHCIWHSPEMTAIRQ